MNIAGHEVGICSWSVQPRSMEDLVAVLGRLGVEYVQLALGELAVLDEGARQKELATLRAAGIHVTSGMLAFPGEDYSTIEQIRLTGGLVPDDLWPQRLQLVRQTAAFASAIGVRSITSHVGFIPHTDAGGGRSRIVERIRQVASIFSAGKIDLLMETGQEPAVELAEFLHEVAAPNVLINFDPANMILYGAGDPIEAMRVLGPFIRHVHVKDATSSSSPGSEWGEEVPFGTGQVGATRFVQALRQIKYQGPLAFEREAGGNRVGDIASGITALRAAAGA